MQNKVSVLFYIKRTKASVKGEVPIYMRVTIGGRRIDKSTGEFVEESRWIKNASKVKATNEAAKKTNDYLDVLKAEVYEHRTEFIRQGKPVSYDNLKNKIFGIEERPLSLIQVFHDHNKNFKALVGKEYAEATYTRYVTTLSHIKQFLKWKWNKTDIDIRNIDHEFVTAFEFFLRTVRDCANNSSVKYVRNFGKIIKICLRNNWIDKDPFINYSAKLHEVETVYLTDDELQTIIDKKFSTTRLDRVRDAFVFSCFTGMAYTDAKKADDSNLITGIDGGKWLTYIRTKTKIKCNIPILPQAQNIINKCAPDPEVLNSGKLLMLLSNQKMNAYLKEIADLCGIKKDLTFHAARHTFATTVTLAKGVPLETVSKMLGHRTLKMTLHYAKIIDTKISQDMAKIRMFFSLPNKQDKEEHNAPFNNLVLMINEAENELKTASSF